MPRAVSRLTSAWSAQWAGRIGNGTAGERNQIAIGDGGLIVFQRNAISRGQVS
jgi:hypothetical protein